MWADALERADAGLRVCDRSPHHVFGDHRRRCPWCERLDAGLPDPFPGPTGRSSLTPLPPPWMVRTRTAVVAKGSSVAGTVSRRAGAGVETAVGWAWSRLRGPLSWPVPLALAFATFGALLPLGGLLVFCVRSGVAIPPNRTRNGWIRVGLDAGGAVAAAGLALAALHRGLPPLADLAATSSALLAFCARSGARRAPERAQKLVVTVLWLAVLGGLAGLAMQGPVWWPVR